MALTRNPRLYGTRLGFTFNGKDYWADITKYDLSAANGDKVVDFGDAASGSVGEWTLKGEGVISFAAGSFWQFIWENAGKTVPFILAPHGNKTAAPGKPHFKCNVTIPIKPGQSLDAGDKEGAKFPFEFDVIGEPQQVTTGSTLGTGNADDVLD